MGYRDNLPASGAAELFCMQCNACCLAISTKVSFVMNGVGERVPTPSFSGDGANGGKFAIELRPYVVDGRFKRTVPGSPSSLMLPGGDLVEITERPGLCSEECAEKLDASWTRDNRVPSPWKRPT